MQKNKSVLWLQDTEDALTAGWTCAAVFDILTFGPIQYHITGGRVLKLNVAL